MRESCPEAIVAPPGDEHRFAEDANESESFPDGFKCRATFAITF
jgi:hypothetical protein